MTWVAQHYLSSVGVVQGIPNDHVTFRVNSPYDPDKSVDPWGTAARGWDLYTGRFARYLVTGACCKVRIRNLQTAVTDGSDIALYATVVDLATDTHHISMNYTQMRSCGLFVLRDLPGFTQNKVVSMTLKWSFRKWFNLNGDVTNEDQSSDGAPMKGSPGREIVFVIGLCNKYPAGPGMNNLNVSLETSISYRARLYAAVPDPGPMVQRPIEEIGDPDDIDISEELGELVLSRDKIAAQMRGRGPSPARTVPMRT